MERRNKKLVALFSVVWAVSFQSSFPAARQPPIGNKSNGTTNAKNSAPSVVFRLSGNVYPLGYYSVNLNIGKPPKTFDFDIDTGSDLTLVQCDAPCNGCTKPPEQQYKLKLDHLVPCSDPRCRAIHTTPGTYICKTPTDQCDYEVEYADHGSSLGVLVKDEFLLTLKNGSLATANVTFGCGYDQENPGPHSPPPTAGILGLGRGKASIVLQLRTLGITQNVIGHCLSRVGGGILFFGEYPVPASGITWTPMSGSSSDTYYSSGPAELLVGGKPTGIKGLQMVFDSGSSYTYFSAQIYRSIVNMVEKELVGKPLKDATEDTTLPICWKASKPIKSIGDVQSYFKPLTIKFTNAKNAELQLAPEDYLIVSKYGNACFGILNGGEQQLGNLNIIGDIFMQHKMVIYDNEKQQIGWFPANCNANS